MTGELRSGWGEASLEGWRGRAACQLGWLVRKECGNGGRREASSQWALQALLRRVNFTLRAMGSL